MDIDYIQKVIIIGAPRSGTNMLRDLLCKMPEIGTWPCDEINYIWRHGNSNYPTDEFKSEFATPDVCRYIQKCFLKIAVKYSLKTVVEKTCANSLRVGFVDKVIPDAKFIFLFRDGRDTVPSAMKRWVAPLDLSYTLKKVRYVPLTDIPYYGVSFIKNRIHRMLSKEKSVLSWGPRFQGMEKMVRSRSLMDVCAIQWSRCITKSTEDLDRIEAARVCNVRYEDFVREPVAELNRLSEFLGIQLSETEAVNSVKNISSKSVGNWKRSFAQEDLEVLEPLIKSSMQRLGYFQ